MKILAIETSCDDTGIAVLEEKNGNFSVLANIIASQVELGKKYGGVYPMMAKREHEKNLTPTLETALSQAKVSLKNIDLIAVTNGPGLEPCLWTGVNFAKDLSKKYNIPLIPVNHIEGHILVNLLPQIYENSKLEIRNSKKIKFPAVALVVSGGHTQIILVKGIGKYKILGETRDDAAGECFDKCAKIMGLGYPGGPTIARLASQWKSENRNPKSETSSKLEIKLPRPMIHTKDYDFSFSGLKTAVLYSWQKEKQKTSQLKIIYAREIQQAIIDVLIKKTMKAVKDFHAKTLILGGGVSANCELRSQFKSEIRNSKSEINLLVPPVNLSTDNGLMIAIAGYFNRAKKIVKSDFTKLVNLKANGNLRIR